MSSGPKKGTWIFYPFLSKCPGNRIPSRFPNRAPMERDTHLQCIFYISLDISLYLKGPKKRADPMATDTHSRALFFISFGVPSKGALLSGPPHGIPSERASPFLQPSFIHHSEYPVYEPPHPPPDSRFPSDKRGTYGERCPYLEPFLTCLLESPVKEPSTVSLFRITRHCQWPQRRDTNF